MRDTQATSSTLTRHIMHLVGLDMTNISNQMQCLRFKNATDLIWFMNTREKSWLVFVK